MMDPRLLRYYERELRHVRELGAEFAKEFPKIAGRIGLDSFECADPYVERLLESFAFLTARVQLNLDAQFPNFTQHMLERLYPNYVAPVPSMAVVQLKPSPREGSLVESFLVPAGTSFRSRLGASQTACEYRSAHDVRLWPIELVSADYSTVLADFIDVQRVGLPRAKAALRLVLHCTGNATFDKLALEDLTLFLRGSNDVTARLYEQMVGANIGLVVQSPERPPRFCHVDPCGVVTARGLDEADALLPCSERSFGGHRLLQEYFAFPERVNFVQIGRLAEPLRAATGSRIEIVLLFSRAEPSLESAVKAEHFGLFCTPVVNLFARSADRLHLGSPQQEHHLVPDRTRPLDLEVHSVTAVVGHGTKGGGGRDFLPMYAADSRTVPGAPRSFYTVRREPRALSTRERARGPRSTYVGSETFLSLVDAGHGAVDPSLRQLAVSTLCTNRDLPLHMSVGHGPSDFTMQSGAPVESVRAVAGPTPPRQSPAFGETSWRLLSHLGLDFTSVSGGDSAQRSGSLRELLGLYADIADPATLKQTQGLVSLDTKNVVRPIPLPGPMTFGRGAELTLTFDEANFEGSGVTLLAAVLSRFFARYASINSFTETVLRTPQRGEVMRWASTPGARSTV
ncbi:MAG: type secretion protein [Myxococcaceae bacterium]|nr:type secretion protein [Myxococcaceae bacterium]